MNTGVDNLIKANQHASEQHRIAYGETMYNQAISDAIQVVCNFVPGNNVTNLPALVEALMALKKPS